MTNYTYKYHVEKVYAITTDYIDRAIADWVKEGWEPVSVGAAPTNQYTKSEEAYVLLRKIVVYEDQ